jgi:hypothetical protein
VLLLNPDTLWLDNSLERMVEIMEKRPEFGALGPKLLNADGSIQFWGARRLPRPLDTFLEFTKVSYLFPHNAFLARQLIGDWDHQDSREVDCLSGACLLIRRDTLNSVGLLDENYRLYSEDTDWCHRVVLAKRRLYYYAEARIIHIGKQSSFQNRGPATIQGVQSVYRYYRKFYGRTTALWIWALMGLAACVKLCAWSLLFLLRGRKQRQNAREQIAAYWKICRLRPEIL